MATKGSSLDRDFVHPHVVEKRIADMINGKKSNGWKTSKIVRVDPEDETSEIVEIKIYKK